MSEHGKELIKLYKQYCQQTWEPTFEGFMSWLEKWYWSEQGGQHSCYRRVCAICGKEPQQ